MQQINQFDWKTYYKFLSLTYCKAYYIPKYGLFTWEDLINALREEMRYQYDLIQIMVNQKKVDYQKQTYLVDIPITEDDDCIIIKRKKFQSQGERKQYQQKRKELRQKCKKEIQREQQYPEIKKMVDYALNKYQSYFNLLRMKYGVINAAMALTKREYEKDQVIRGFIERGDAYKYALRIMIKNQKKQLETFLQNESIKEIYDQIFKKLDKYDQNLYRGVMQELYHVYPDFRRLQFRHRKIVKKFFFGQKYELQFDSEIQQENLGEQIKIKEKRRSQFLQKMRYSYSDQQIIQSLYQSGNDYGRAEQLLKNDLAYGVQNMPFIITKKGRIDYLLYFLANPKFDKIREKLFNNNDKARIFLDWIRETNADNIALCQLIKRYKDYALSFLTGIDEVKKKMDSSKQMKKE